MEHNSITMYKLSLVPIHFWARNIYIYIYAVVQRLLLCGYLIASIITKTYLKFYSKHGSTKQIAWFYNWWFEYKRVSRKLFQQNCEFEILDKSFQKSKVNFLFLKGFNIAFAYFSLILSIANKHYQTYCNIACMIRANFFLLAQWL